MSGQAYAKPIRIFHSLFALLMLLQLAVGNLMEVPEVEEEHHASLQLIAPAQAHETGMAHSHGISIVAEAHAHEGQAHTGNGPVEESAGFEVHEVLGLIIAGLVVIRLLLAMTSLPGANWRDLFPWLLADGREKLLQEVKTQLPLWKSGKLAAPEEGEMVARSMHGLILLASVVMAITGIMLFLGWSTTAPQNPLVHLIAEVHEMVVFGLEMLLIAHVAAVVVHFRQGHNLLTRISPKG